MANISSSNGPLSYLGSLRLQLHRIEEQQLVKRGAIAEASQSGLTIRLECPLTR